MVLELGFYNGEGERARERERERIERVGERYVSLISRALEVKGLFIGGNKTVV
jgi:hypothetical protein